MTEQEWLNPPAGWTGTADSLSFTTGPSTDFWRKTHNGAIRDNGHFRYRTVIGDFTARVKVIGQYEALYDQAGLMLRLDEATWLKCGVEFVDGIQYASAVVTRDFSDWSVTPLPDNPPALHLKLTREGGTVEIGWSLYGSIYTMCRTAHLTSKPELQVGPMAASPKGPGFTVAFEGLAIGPREGI